MINRLWVWLKAMFDRLFRRKETPVKEAPAEGGHRIRNIFDKGGRHVSTRGGGPNMPKHQPCPLCRRMVKRVRKTISGAHYYCKRCKNGAFVRSR